MGIMDKLFGANKKINSLEKQVKALQSQNLGMIVNASTSIFPTWQVYENVNTYISVDDVYSIISLLAETAARIPMYGYQIVDDSSMKSYKKFDYNTIHRKYYQQKAMIDLPETDKFNQFLQDISYEDKIKYYSLLYINGEVFLYKEKIELGPNAGKVYLHALNSQNVTVVVSEDFPQRVLRYDYFDVGFDGSFSADEVIHIKYFNPSIYNGQFWRGLSPLQVLSKRLTRLNAAMDASVAQMQNGGVPGIVYEKSDYAIETLGQRKNDFSSYLRNSSNKGAPYFAAGEMGYLQLGLSLADMDVNDLSGLDFTKLCNAYKVPEVLLNNQDSSTFNNVGAAEKMLYTNTILPNIHLFRDAMVKSVAPLFADRIKRTIEIDLSTIPALQQDMKTQADALNAMWWVTPNEKRDLMEFETLEDPLMNQILIDSGKMLLSDLGAVPDVIIPESESGLL